jgi:hypothetical protein
VPQLGPVAAYAADAPTARVDQVTVSGLEGGKVMIGDKEILTLAVPAAGFLGTERAAIVADRINRALEAGLTPDDIVIRTEYGSPVIRTAADAVLVTVTPDDARLMDQTPEALAEQWAGNLRVALGGAPIGGAPDGGAIVDGEWQPAEPYGDKFVPILSLLEGVRVGVARVNGPRSRLALTQGVAQFSVEFRHFLEIDIYVPVSTRVPGRTIDRVQGVGVTGLGDIRL